MTFFMNEENFSNSNPTVIYHVFDVRRILGIYRYINYQSFVWNCLRVLVLYLFLFMALVGYLYADPSFLSGLLILFQAYLLLNQPQSDLKSFIFELTFHF